MRSFQENFTEFVKDSRKCNLLFDYSSPIGPYEVLVTFTNFHKSWTACSYRISRPLEENSDLRVHQVKYTYQTSCIGFKHKVTSCVDRPTFANKQLLWRKPHERISQFYFSNYGLRFIGRLTNGFPKQCDSSTRWFITQVFLHVHINFNIFRSYFCSRSNKRRWHYNVQEALQSHKHIYRGLGQLRIFFSSIVHEANKWFPFTK